MEAISKRFPFVVFYTVSGGTAWVHAVVITVEVPRGFGST
jgi:hypothetical protein